MSVESATRAAALEAVDAAGEGLRASFRGVLEAEVKDAASPIVTEADRAAERAIREVLRLRTPDVGILGEELATERPDAPLRWVIDPIDGTIAFACGKPLFTTLLALTEHGRSVLGIIDQPVIRERWVGDGDQTTLTDAYGERVVSTRRGVALREARLACTAPGMFRDRPGLVDRLRDAVHVITWGGDAYNLGLLASGHVDIIVEAGLEPYDYAPWAPIVKGAGGRLTDWSGQPLDDVDGTRNVVACGDPALVDPVLELIRG
ncbi:MAG: inositol monophosphatase family protein [Myxococcota bacterium]